MKTTFATNCVVFDPSVRGGFRSKHAVLETTWDWFPLQTALLLGALWHAKMQSRSRGHNAVKRQTYSKVANAISGLLHRLGDLEPDIDDDGHVIERERNPDWARQDGLNQVVSDIRDWMQTGTPRYRVQAWAPQWEALRSARTVLEWFGEQADSNIFNAVMDLEALQEIGNELNPGARYRSMIALCEKSVEHFGPRPHTEFLVEPIRQLATLLQSVGDSYEVRYTLTAPGSDKTAL